MDFRFSFSRVILNSYNFTDERLKFYTVSQKLHRFISEITLSDFFYWNTCNWYTYNSNKCEPNLYQNRQFSMNAVFIMPCETSIHSSKCYNRQLRPAGLSLNVIFIVLKLLNV